ncbi:MAG TPA: class I SAM-dependent methyltransferase [Chitinophagaceae bacterium]|jgi:ubiquinone/menaquinone biosynthesis C-methylase UbiE
MKKTADAWDESDPYEYFMGRWSKRIAPLFLSWLNLPSNLSWLDIGCGTGTLSEAIFSICKPAHLSCIDPSSEFLAEAKKRLPVMADVVTGSASDIPKPNNSFDTLVSGLALNFFPDLSGALSEMKRVVKSNGIIAAYVWDYAGRMDFLRIFWDAASQVDHESYKFDEGIRFPLCNAHNLWNEFEKAGFINIETTNMDAYTVFKNFEDYWNPFLGGQGPAGAYLVSLNRELQDKLKSNLFKRLPGDSNGSIKLLARAIAVRGIRK